MRFRSFREPSQMGFRKRRSFFAAIGETYLAQALKRTRTAVEEITFVQASRETVVEDEIESIGSPDKTQ